MESGRAVPPELEGSIRSLSERLDRMQLSQGDQLALGALEDRIAKLSEKLDASDSRPLSGDWRTCWFISRRCETAARAACAPRRPNPPAHRPNRHPRRPKRRQQRACLSRRWRNRRSTAPRRCPWPRQCRRPKHSCRRLHRCQRTAIPRIRRRAKCRAGPNARSNPACRPILRSSPAAAPRV